MDKRPFMYKEDDKFVGFHYEVAQEMSKKLGVGLEAFDAPVMRVVEMLKNKKSELSKGLRGKMARISNGCK